MSEETEIAIKQHLAAQELTAAFTLAVRAYGPNLQRLIASLVRESGAANEVYSTTLLNIWRGIGGYTGAGSFRGWMRTIARNAANRHHATAWERDVERGELTDVQQPPPRSPTPRWKHSDQRRSVRALFDRLAPLDRALMVAHVDWRWTWEEVGQHLGMSSGACRTRFTRTKERLKRMAQGELQSGIDE